MAFKEYRNSSKSPKAHEFDIERFAYDVFAYMLPICGFPEAEIPITTREENIYNERDFVLNFGLSVLPLALYMRDNWRCLFETKYEQNGFHHASDIQVYLESVLNSGEIHDEDTISKVQFSLALYNEFILFCNYKGLDAYFGIMPKLWSQLCKQLIPESQDFHRMFEFSFITHPDGSEVWLTTFIRANAIPYGCATNVSDNFSLYAFECLPENTNNNTDEISKERNINNPPDVLAQASNVLDINSEPSLIEDSKTGLCTGSGRGESPVSSERMQKKNGENSVVEAKEHAKIASGLTCVLQQYLKRRKRNRSPNLEIEGAFKEISLENENENSSPENRDTKRRCKTSNNDIPE